MVQTKLTETREEVEEWKSRFERQDEAVADMIKRYHADLEVLVEKKEIQGRLEKEYNETVEWVERNINQAGENKKKLEELRKTGKEEDEKYANILADQKKKHDARMSLLKMKVLVYHS